ncbi:conserved hypothetical protein, partial [Aspergillus fumigatus A1163]
LGSGGYWVSVQYLRPGHACLSEHPYGWRQLLERVSGQIQRIAVYALRMLTVRKSRKCHLRAYQDSCLVRSECSAGARPSHYLPTRVLDFLEIITQCLDRLGRDRALKILDLGGGTGRYAKLGYSVTLVDISDQELKIAHRTAEEAQVKLTAIAIPTRETSAPILPSSRNRNTTWHYAKRDLMRLIPKK